MELIATIRWGDIPLALDDYPLFAEIAAEQMRKVRAPVRIRLDHHGGLHALARMATAIYHLDPGGKVAGATPFSGVDATAIVDYAVDARRNCYLLEAQRLRRLGEDGAPSWSRDLHAPVTRLFVDGQWHLFLPGTQLVELDPANGATLREYPLPGLDPDYFVDPNRRVLSIVFDSDRNQRGLVVYSLTEGQTKSVFNDQLYTWLVSPIGVDALPRLYVWHDATLARISTAGEVDVLASFDNVVVRASDHTIYTSMFVAAENQLYVETAAQRRALAIPSDMRAGPSDTPTAWSLVQVDDAERCFVVGGERPGQPSTLLVYSKTGALDDRRSPPGDLLALESRLEPYTFWQIDAQGRAYLPITTPEGLNVVRLSP